jgi:GrpB-like predicted nucleotidyltransferase (UPF0157 family)
VTELDLVGGPEAVAVTLHHYDPRWPELFREHERRIVAALATTGTQADVEHIGSTSVPGLAAKPIVDVVVAVDDVTAEEDWLAPLLAAGYVLRVREPGHRLVRTPSTTAGLLRWPSTSSSATTFAVTTTTVRSTNGRSATCSPAAGTT